MATDLVALKALLAAATKGEWEQIPGTGGIVERPRGLIIDCWPRFQNDDAGRNNAAFIVAAHNALPGLIAEVERLREAASLLLEQKRAGETTVIAWQMLAEALAGDRHD